MKTTFIVATVMGLASYAPVAQAQGVFDMGILTNTLSIDHVTQSERKRASGQSGTTRSRRSTRSSTKNAGASTTMPFAQSATLRKQHLASFVAGVRRADPGNAAQLEKLFTSQDVFKFTDIWMKKYGLKSNNLADPLAVYFTTTWLVARGSNADPTKAQIIGVRNQMARALGNAPAFKRVTATQKQALADNLVLQSYLFSAYLEAGKTKPLLKEQSKQLAALSVQKSFGVNIKAVKLTNLGLQ
jgi:hypothetical protein